MIGPILLGIILLLALCDLFGITTYDDGGP
jgi:hypothetical protein